MGIYQKELEPEFSIVGSPKNNSDLENEITLLAGHMELLVRKKLQVDRLNSEQVKEEQQEARAQTVSKLFHLVSQR